MGAYLTSIGNDLYCVLVEENEAAISEANEWADLTQVGTEAIHAGADAVADPLSGAADDEAALGSPHDPIAPRHAQHSRRTLGPESAITRAHG